MKDVFLETQRLLLRRFTDADFDDFYTFAADREMCRMMGRADLTDIHAARLNFLYLKDGSDCGLAIVLKQSGRVVGNLTIDSPSFLLANAPALQGKRGCSLSFCIGREHQHRGLMTEAVRAVIDRLFRAEDYDYINCSHFVFNLASCALQKKLGFQFFLREKIVIEGEEIEVIENILWK